MDIKAYVIENVVMCALFALLALGMLLKSQILFITVYPPEIQERDYRSQNKEKTKGKLTKLMILKKNQRESFGFHLSTLKLSQPTNRTYKRYETRWNDDIPSTTTNVPFTKDLAMSMSTLPIFLPTISFFSPPRIFSYPFLKSVKHLFHQRSNS